jgi:hypothetical protein
MLGVVKKAKYKVDGKYDSNPMSSLKPGDHVVE